MNVKLITGVVLALLITQSCDFVTKAKFSSTINSNSDEVFIKLDTINDDFGINEFCQQGRLYYMAKIWGRIKYRGISKTDNLDSSLLNAIPNIISANNKKAFNAELESFLCSVIDSELLKDLENNKSQSSDTAHKRWCEDTVYFSDKIQNYLHSLNQPKHWSTNNYVKQNAFGIIKIAEHIKDTNACPNIRHRLFGLFDYWNLIDNYYVHKGIMGHNWDSVLYHTIPDFLNCSDSIEYNKAILKLTALLNDTHVFTTSETIDSVIFGGNIPPFTLYRFNDRFYVDGIYLKDFNILQIGDEVVTVNDIEIKHLYDSIALFKGLSVKRKNKKVGWLVYSTPKDSISIGYIRNDSANKVNVVCKSYRKITSEKRQDKTEKAKDYRIEKLVNGVSYFHIQYLTKRNISKIIDDIGKNDTVVFDLRGYPEYGVSLRLIDFFISKRSRFATITYPDIKNPGIIRTNKGEKAWKFSNSFEGLLIILVDENTMSEAEYLTMALQKAKNAITVGSTTVGADGNVIFYTFPGNVQTCFTGIGIFYPDMTPTQRVGIKIDHYVEPTLDDIIKRRDPVLEFVIDTLLAISNVQCGALSRAEVCN